MSERALEFVEQWVADHIGSVNDPSQAKLLTAQCVLAASEEGIPQWEISEAFDNLAEFIATEIAEANERAGRTPTSEEEIAEEVDREASDLADDEEDDERTGDAPASPKK
jgi:hypothetical protein